MKKKLLMFDLSMFDGAEGADGATGDSSGTAQLAEELGLATQEAETEDNPLATEEEETLDKSQQFEELIKGEYKEEYQKRFNKALNARFKQNNELEEELNEYRRLGKLLSSRYDVDGNAPADIAAAIEEDDEFFETRALEEGMDVDTYKRLLKMEQENADYRRAEEERQHREGISQVYNEWVNQAEEAKEFFPSLDLEEECENEQFLRLLEVGVDVKTAYQVLHQDELVPQIMKASAQKAQEDVISNINARKRRPVENGNTQGGAVSTKLDPSKFTNKQLDEINRRVMRGEKISF